MQAATQHGQPLILRQLSLRTRWAIALSLGVLTAWTAPPFPWQARRVASRLAVRAGCPRAVPRVESDSVRGLTDVQRCGVLWAGLEALPPAGAEYVRAHASDLAGVTVLAFDESVATGGDVFADPHWIPPEPFPDRQRWSSRWSFSVMISGGGPADALTMIHVDKRSGIARRFVLQR